MIINDSASKKLEVGLRFLVLATAEVRLPAKKEAPPITEERPLAIVKSEDAAVLPRDSPPSGHPTPIARQDARERAAAGSRWLTDKRARAFLQQRLKDGPKPGAELEAAAKAVAIPESALIRAADALGVLSRRGEWRLPAATKAAAESA